MIWKFIKELTQELVNLGCLGARLFIWGFFLSSGWHYAETYKVKFPSWMCSLTKSEECYPYDAKTATPVYYQGKLYVPKEGK